MKSSNTIKIGLLTMAVWLGLVAFKMAPVGPFVAVLAAIMQALYHLTYNKQQPPVEKPARTKTKPAKPDIPAPKPKAIKKEPTP